MHIEEVLTAPEHLLRPLSQEVCLRIGARSLGEPIFNQSHTYTKEQQAESIYSRLGGAPSKIKVMNIQH
jgi:hypothetical protein